MARRPYTTRARLIQGDTTEVDLVWYPADPAAGTLPFPSRVCSLDWNSEPWTQEGVGEVYGADRDYNHKRLRKGLFSPDHVCGTPEDFFSGQVGLAIPPTVYDKSGLPECCGVKTVQHLVPVASTIVSTVRLIPPVYYTRTVPAAATVLSRVGYEFKVRTLVPVASTILSTLYSGNFQELIPVKSTIESTVILTMPAYSTCEDAYPLGQDVQPPFDLTPGRPWWFRLGGLKAPLPYSLHLLGTLMEPGNTQLLTGDNCGALIDQPYTIYTSDCWGWYQLDYLSTYVVVTPTVTITAGTAFLWNRTLCSGQPG